MHKYYKDEAIYNCFLSWKYVLNFTIVLSLKDYVLFRYIPCIILASVISNIKGISLQARNKLQAPIHMRSLEIYESTHLVFFFSYLKLNWLNTHTANMHVCIVKAASKVQGPIVKKLHLILTAWYMVIKILEYSFQKSCLDEGEFPFSSEKYHTTFSCRSNELRFVNLKWKLHMRRN